MKTTIEIPDALLAEAKRVAAKEKTTVKALVQDGLRKVLQERKNHKPFKLRQVTFGGQGLHPDVAGLSWEQIRDMIYEDRERRNS